MSLLSKNECYEQEYNKDNKEIQFTAQNNLATTLLFQMKINEFVNTIEQNRMAQKENKQKLRRGGAGLADERSEEGRSAKPRGRGLGRSN